MEAEYVGMSNPADEVEAPKPPEEFFFGKWMDKEEFLDVLNAMLNGRAVFTEDEHCDGRLYLGIEFKEA